MATVFCRLCSLAPLAVGLALCTGPRAVNAQVPISPEYENLRREVDVSGDVFLGIMTGKLETEVRPVGSEMHVYVWIPEKLVADTPACPLYIRVQSIDGLYEAVLRVTSGDQLKKEPNGAYKLAYTTKYNDSFGVRQANEVALHAFWSKNCEAPEPDDPRLVATWDSAGTYPNTVWLLLNNPEGRALQGEERCRSLEAIDRTLVSYDKVCEAVLNGSPDTLMVGRWDGIEFQGYESIIVHRPARPASSQ